MNNRKLGAGKAAMWFVATILALSAVMLLGGCRKRKTVVLHEPDIYVASHGDHDGVVVVERAPRRASTRMRRRHREEARHEDRDRRDGRRKDRRDDDRPRSRRR